MTWPFSPLDLSGLLACPSGYVNACNVFEVKLKPLPDFSMGPHYSMFTMATLSGNDNLYSKIVSSGEATTKQPKFPTTFF